MVGTWNKLEDRHGRPDEDSYINHLSGEILTLGPQAPYKVMLIPPMAQARPIAGDRNKEVARRYLMGTMKSNPFGF